MFLFNNVFNPFGIRHVVKDHSNNRTPLPSPLCPISSMGCFTETIPQSVEYMAYVKPVSNISWSSMNPPKGMDLMTRHIVITLPAVLLYMWTVELSIKMLITIYYLNSQEMAFSLRVSRCCQICRYILVLVE